VGQFSVTTVGQFSVAITIDSSVFGKYPEIEWQNIMKLRDIISHHYEHVDHEIIYDICKNHLPNLKKAVQRIYKEQTGSL